MGEYDHKFNEEFLRGEEYKKFLAKEKARDALNERDASPGEKGLAILLLLAIVWVLIIVPAKRSDNYYGLIEFLTTLLLALSFKKYPYGKNGSITNYLYSLNEIVGKKTKRIFPIIGMLLGIYYLYNNNMWVEQTIYNISISTLMAGFIGVLGGFLAYFFMIVSLRIITSDIRTLLVIIIFSIYYIFGVNTITQFFQL